MGHQTAGSSGTDDFEARAIAWIEAHCAEQNVPVKLADPVALAKVAEILAQGRTTGVSRVSSKRLKP